MPHNEHDRPDIDNERDFIPFVLIVSGLAAFFIAYILLFGSST